VDSNRRFIGEETNGREVSYPLKVADRYVNLLCDLPRYRELTTEELFKLLAKSGKHARSISKAVPPVGDDLGIREAAYEREERQRRAVIIGMLAKPEEIQQHYGQKFLERL
jgi:hypothetical protein